MLRTIREQWWPRIPTLRIQPTNRISLDRELARHFARLPGGVVLDVGAKASPYRELIPHERYLRLDVNPASAPDFCADLHDFEHEPEAFDAVVALEVLEHLYAPERAIDRIRHVLKPGGVCLLSTRFLYRYHADPHDYYRFTPDSLRYLFRTFSRVEVHPHGNRVQTIWEMINAGGRGRVVLNLLNPLMARWPSRDTRFPLGFVVVAVK